MQEVSIIPLVDQLVQKAIEFGASDIHLEPMQKQVRIRFRIDGILIDQEPLLITLYPQIVARFKVLAHMDSTVKRIPQDGKFCIEYKESAIDIRLSTFPSVWGEKLVVRILDSSVHTITLESLGFDPCMLETFKNLINHAHGFFLVTGPTGSGKTTTLYAVLEALHNPERNIVTLEDPVEYSLNGVTQSQINPDAGFTFDNGIRSLLRQDPDVIMIGEIRDKQTAHTAMEAAMTGHIVLSTLHTGDAPSAIIRLMDMGIESYLINASLTGVLAQRLVRKLCDNCKILKDPTQDEQVVLERIGVPPGPLYHSQGCEGCNWVGYKGRMAIFELLAMSPALRVAIGVQPHIDRLYAIARQEGMRTLQEDAIEKMRAGHISLRELIRVII